MIGNDVIRLKRKNVAMSRRSEGQLFVGRLSKTTRVRDLEDIFEPYGRLARCDVKYGAEMAYAFVDFEDRRDGEDALRYENGRKLCGSSIIVEWAKGNPRRPMGSQGHETYDECYRCHRPGHWARDCPDDRSFSRGGYRSPSPRRRRRRSYRSKSRSRSRSRRRSRSRSRNRRKRSRSRSRSRSRDRRSKRSRRSRSRSRDKKKPVSRSRSRSRSKKKSVSRSKSRSRSRSPSRSPSAGQTNGDQEQERSDRSRASSAAPSEPPSGSPPPADD